jgi:integrase
VKQKKKTERLTKDTVDEMPFPVGCQVIVWDEDLAGFGLRLSPSKKTYIAQGRVRGTGATRRVSLGEHGVLTPQQARKRAKKELSAMLEGSDPSQEKKRAKIESVTLRRVAEAYLEDRRDLKPSSRADIKKHLKGSFADWADRPFIDITREKVMTRFKELSDRSAAQGNQAFRILRALLNYSRGKYRHGYEPILRENPVKVLSDTKTWNRVKFRSGRIPTDRIGAVWNLLQGLRTSPEQTRIGQTSADAVCFLLLTGCRWSEMSELTWDWVSLEGGFWYLPDPKNRQPITFPLSEPAVRILSECPRKGTYVFPARSGDGHIHDARGIFEKISSLADTRITAHDLRRTFRAVAGEVGVEFWKTKLLMGHKISGDVTISHYTEKSDLRYLSSEINIIAGWIESKGAKAMKENIVTFPVMVES